MEKNQIIRAIKELLKKNENKYFFDAGVSFEFLYYGVPKKSYVTSVWIRNNVLYISTSTEVNPNEFVNEDEKLYDFCTEEVEKVYNYLKIVFAAKYCIYE